MLRHPLRDNEGRVRAAVFIDQWPASQMRDITQWCVPPPTEHASEWDGAQFGGLDDFGMRDAQPVTH